MIKSILETIRKPKTTSVDLRAALAQLSIEDAEKRVDGLEAERRRILLDGTDKELTAIETQITAANRDVERTAAAIEELKARLAQAEQAESDAGRRKQYDEAKAAADVGRKALLSIEKKARAIVEDLRFLAEAELTVRRANESLP